MDDRYAPIILTEALPPAMREERPELTNTKGCALKELRNTNWRRALTTDFPLKSDESWRWTDFGDFDPQVLAPAEWTVELFQAPATDPKLAGSLLITPTKAYVSLSKEARDADVLLLDLGTAIREQHALTESLIGRLITGGEDKFAAIASALGRDGVFLHLPTNVILDKPIFIKIDLGRNSLSHYPRVVLSLAENASATVILEITGGTDKTLLNSIVEIYLSQNATLKLTEVQELNDGVWNISHEKAHVETDARLEWTYGALGSHMSKNFITVDLVGSGSIAVCKGFYFASGLQRLDLDTQQNHLSARTTSDLLYKGAATDQGKATWEGMIYVDHSAQQADGFQANRNLVLSATAEINTIPGLEICADDVRCSHGATVGRLNDDELFYLRCRGIPLKQARELIVEGFFAGILDLVPVTKTKDELTDKIKKKLSRKSEEK